MSTIHIAPDVEFSENFEIRARAIEELRQRIIETPVDTRDGLSAWQPVADEYQKRVIDDASRVLRVVAPAGSGKTQTLINRVVQSVARGSHPARILLLTFDNSAVSSLRESVQRQLQALAADQRKQLEGVLQQLRISTLNAFGYSLLRDYAKEDYRPIAESRHQHRLFRKTREALKQKSPQREAALPTNVRNRFYLELFSLLKNQTFDPRRPEHQKIADFLVQRPGLEVLFPPPRCAETVKAVVQAVLWMFEKYDQHLSAEGKMDFDDQKLRAYAHLSTQPTLRSTVQSQFSQVIVDEFQDINLLDFALIRLVAASATLVVTGDDDQAIYGFRGCSPEYIINLHKHLDLPISSHELRTNYRCPRNFVQHADRLIRHNTWRIAKSPIAHSERTSQIKVVSAWNADFEARAVVVPFIKKLMRAKPELAFRDFAVLYRTNAQSLPLQLHFVLNDIPYLVREEDNILDNEELMKLLAVLRAKRDLSSGRHPSVEDAVLSVQAYFRYVDPRDADRVRAFFSTSRDLPTVLRSMGFFRILPKARDSRIGEAFQDLIEATSLSRTLEVAANQFHGLRKMIGSLEDVVDESMPLGEVFEIAAGFKGSVSEFIDTVEHAVDIARSSSAGRNEDNGVALLTYFRAKGRQWHSVVLTTCNDGLIPHRRAPVEEERRLFYVAMTRATSNLLLSYLKKACGNGVQPSRFLGEAGLLP